MSLTINEKQPKGFFKAWKGVYDFGIATSTTAFTNFTTMCKYAVSPVLCNRPDEIILDSLHFSIPMFSHTNACINYIKRRIRQAVFFNMKEKGTITFSINPKDSWML